MFLAIIILGMVCLSSCAYQNYKAHLFTPKRANVKTINCRTYEDQGKIHGNLNKSMKYYYKQR